MVDTKRPHGGNHMTIKFEMPTEAELQASSEAWYAPLKGTMLDELPPDVLALSVPTTFIDFPVELIEPLFGTHPKACFGALIGEMDDVMGWDTKFVKLNSRSAKDIWDGFTCSGKHALANMSGSMRILDDLSMFSHMKVVTPKICIRDIFRGAGGPGTWEFRCFVKDGDLIAVSDYDYTKPNEYLLMDSVAKKIRLDINDFHHDLQQRMEIETYVFDVVFTGADFTLIEVNPYGLSDPCFFGSYANVEASNTWVQTSTPILSQENEDG